MGGSLNGRPFSKPLASNSMEPYPTPTSSRNEYFECLVILFKHIFISIFTTLQTWSSGYLESHGFLESPGRDDLVVTVVEQQPCRSYPVTIGQWLVACGCTSTFSLCLWDPKRGRFCSLGFCRIMPERGRFCRN